MSIKLWLLSALFYICLTKSFLNDNWDPVPVYKYSYSLGEDVFPISGWIAPTAIWKSNTNEQYKVLKDAGLTSIYGHYETYQEGQDNSEVYKALEYASNNNVKYFVTDESLWKYEGKEFQEQFEKRQFTNYSSFAGFMFFDEPSTEAQVNNIAINYEKFKTYVPAKYAFIVNNLPFVSFKTMDNYKQFLDSLLKKAPLPYLSFDFYPISGNFPSVNSLYFESLNGVETFAREHKIPSWPFALSTGHKNVKGGFYRSPTDVDIYWQVNTALAYGAKALTYFCYQVPRDGPDFKYVGQGGSFIDEKGLTTNVYQYGKKINDFIHSVEKIIMNMAKIGMLKHETGKVPAKLFGNFLHSIREIRSLDCYDDILVSVFDHKGKTVCFIVNISLVDNATFKLNFDNEYECTISSMDSDTEKIKTMAINKTLLPGRAILVQIN